MNLSSADAAVGSVNRKRSRRCLEVQSSPGDDVAQSPLKGVVVCLSGLSADEKEQLHRAIESLGGQFTRDLDATKNTHLVARKAEGAKYETALSFAVIKIVQPSWIEECVTQGKRVDEREHLLVAAAGINNTRKQQLSLPSLPDAISQHLANFDCRTGILSALFSSCQFCLIGFETDSDVHNNLGRLIRRGLGTIFWDANRDAVTHVIVNNDCDETIRESVETLRLRHANELVIVSPWWVLAALEKNRIVDASRFPPLYQRARKKKTLEKGQDPAQNILSVRGLTLFRGCFFVLLRVSPPPFAVDYDAEALEQSIRDHGAQMLSLKLVEALKVDRNNISCEEDKRKCYVVCWGGYTPSHMSIHPLLAQVKRHDLCEILQVTPIWLKACCSEQKCIPVGRLPILFEPNNWPIRSLESKETIGKGDVHKGIRISVTGFSGSKRTAIVHLIHSMGAVYDDSMRSSTTHLICREGRGQKYLKALEWKIAAVSVDWLYHVAQYGYGGEENKSGGCESGFSVIPAML